MAITEAKPAWKDLPGGNAKGLFGEEDHLGCLNLLTPERTAAAVALVKSGESFGLDGSMKDWPNPSPFSADGPRQPPVHHVLKLAPLIRDEYFDAFYPQAGSQWDHFLHVGDPNAGTFYNGSLDESVGIAAWAKHGIVGRAVLLDVAAWAQANGRPLNFRVRSEITVADLEACAKAQGTTFQEGTILLVRSGWEEGYKQLTPEQRLELSNTPGMDAPGLEASAAMAERLWDWGVAAVAADNPTLEAWPPPEEWLHYHLLGRLGIPIGEYWLLDDLAAACANAGRYEFFLTSAPFNLQGGVGSTANAIAIL